MSDRSLRLKLWGMLFRWRAEESAGIKPDLAERVDELCRIAPTDAETAAAKAEAKQRDAPALQALRRIMAFAHRARSRSIKTMESQPWKR